MKPTAEQIQIVKSHMINMVDYPRNMSYKLKKRFSLEVHKIRFWLYK